VLKFCATAAAQVTAEQWHPDQQLTLNDDGSLCLSLPYDAKLPTELIADILSYGSDVEVVSPPSLRLRVKNTLLAMLKRYEVG
jgi:predicted DNA-binding transcriptional regulator YafY